jgi:mono/diheme cytochrome c family protein
MASTLLYDGLMRARVTDLKADISLRSRKSMIDTLVRHLKLLRLTAGAIAIIAMGCTGLIEGNTDGNLTPEQTAARTAWLEEAQPVLAQNCEVCHNGSRPGVGFLEGADPLAQRDDLLAHDPVVVNLTAPQSSRILTKGLHEGPALSPSQTSSVLQWIQKQKDATEMDGTGNPTLETAPFIPQICTSGAPGTIACPYNDVFLDDLGAPAAKIRFTVQALGSGLYLSNLSLVPGPMGVYIEHPLFVSKPATGDAKPDTIDRFFNVKMNLDMAATPAQQQIAGGTAAFVGFASSDPISIYFKAVKVFQPDMGGMMTQNNGCKTVPQFMAIRTQFSAPQGGAAQACTACHAGANAGATGAMTLTNIGTADPVMLKLVCDQVLIRANKDDFELSGIYLAPAPASTHPFRFTQVQLDGFKAQVNMWLMAEKTAP